MYTVYLKKSDLWTGRKYLKTVYLKKSDYPKYIRNPYCSIAKTRTDTKRTKNNKTTRLKIGQMA